MNSLGFPQRIKLINTTNAVEGKERGQLFLL
jgi:hypothetical protein